MRIAGLQVQHDHRIGYSISTFESKKEVLAVEEEYYNENSLPFQLNYLGFSYYLQGACTIRGSTLFAGFSSWSAGVQIPKPVLDDVQAEINHETKQDFYT